MRLQGVEGGEDAGVVWQRVFELEAALAASSPTSSPRSADQGDADQVQVHHRPVRTGHSMLHAATCSRIMHAALTRRSLSHHTVLGRNAGGSMHGSGVLAQHTQTSSHSSLPHAHMTGAWMQQQLQ